MAFQIEGKEMYPIFVFVKCCWSIHSRVVRLGSVRTANREKPLSHKLCGNTTSLCRCPTSSVSI